MSSATAEPPKEILSAPRGEGSFAPGKDVVFGTTPPTKELVFGAMRVAVYGPQHYPVKEYYPPGLYVREIEMPAGHFICGEVHKTEHVNTISKGRVLVMMEGVLKEYSAPATFVSKPGVSKRLLVLDDCVWSTYHPFPDNEKDPAQIRERLIEESTTAIDFEAELHRMQKLLPNETDS